MDALQKLQESTRNASMVRRNNLLFLLMVVAIILIAGCTQTKNISNTPNDKTPSSNITKDISDKPNNKAPLPDLSLAGEFMSKGCVYEKGTKLNCSAIGLEKKFSCYDISLPRKGLKELSPNVSIVECKFNSFDVKTKEGIIAGSGGEGSYWYVKYLTISNNEIIEIKSEEAFKEFFAPIQTSKEALAYLLGIKPSYSPSDKIEIPKGYNVLVNKDEIKPTQIIETKEGFEINLFYTNYETCGGPIQTYENKYLVTKNGEVKSISKQIIYEGGSGYCT